MADPVEFERLYRLHNRHVFFLCLRMVRNTTEAEDLVQEVFLQVFRKMNSFRGESAFYTWLRRVAINAILMNLRKHRVRDKVPLPQAGESDSAPGQGGPEVSAPDLTLTYLIDRLELERAAGRLPRGYRRVLLLHDVAGYEHQEIAALLNTTAGNSKSQLHRARCHMRKLLRNPSRELLHRPSARDGLGRFRKNSAALVAAD